MGNLSVTATAVKATTPLNSVRGVSGGTITAGMAVYKDVDGSYKPSDANGTAPANMVSGVALNGASTGQPVSVCTQDALFFHGLTGVVAGDVILLSESPGQFTKTPADIVSPGTIVVIGVCLSATQMNLNPTPGGAI